MKKSILLFGGLVSGLIISQAQIVTDYDGNVYDTVIIGTQVWMKQNLKVTHYNNGNPIPVVTDSATWANLTTGSRCYYNNDSTAFDSVYGSLYNWYAVQDINGICPEAWHVSTDADWQTAEGYLGGASIAGGKMKEAGLLHWKSPNEEATNSTGFSGLPGGMRDLSNKFSTLGENGLWWTTSEFDQSFVWSTYMWYLNAGIDHNPTPKYLGLSVRCIKDISSGQKDLIKLEHVKVFPNPAGNKLTILSTENQDFVMKIFNSAGVCVFYNKITQSTENIDISNLSGGIYFLNFFAADWAMQVKMVKE